MAPETVREQNAEQSQILAPIQGVKAALYARVSTDRQREEATIESQLFELKRQIAAAGHALVKEYIDQRLGSAPRSPFEQWYRNCGLKHHFAQTTKWQPLLRRLKRSSVSGRCHRAQLDHALSHTLGCVLVLHTFVERVRNVMPQLQVAAVCRCVTASGAHAR